MMEAIRSSLIAYRKKQNNSKTTNNEKRTTNRTGFTLVELMIAISIIAIISAVGLISYSQAQLLGRDAKRKQDLRSIALALEIYKQQNGRYPLHTTTVNSTDPTPFWVTDTESASRIPLDTTYIKTMPIDPKNNGALNSGATANVYSYSYNTPNAATLPCMSPYPTVTGQFYTLRTRLENKNDPDACKIKQNKNCDGLVICRSPDNTSKEDLFIITSE